MPINVGTGQLTLTDMNDVIAQTTAPEFPIEGTLWFNTTEGNLYIYTNGNWLFSADGLENSTGNLLENSSITGVVGRWNKSTIPTIENVDFQGKIIPTLNATSTTDSSYIHSDVIVDPSKAYEVTLWFKQSTTNGSAYFGLYGYDSAGTLIGVELVNDTTGVLSAPNTNSYVWSASDHLPINTWVKKTFYIMPVGTDPTQMKSIGENVTSNVRMTADTRRIRIRYLNWSNAGVAKTIWVAHPKMVEVDANAILKISNISNTIGNMANDGLLDYNERKVIKDKITDVIGYVIADATTTLPTTATLDAGLKGNFYMYRKRALNAGITSADTAHYAKYTAVVTKYNDLKTYLEGLTPIDAWDIGTTNQASNITVVKATFRDNWLQYYLALEDLAEATTAKLKENVDNVIVGGTNYASNGDFQIALDKSLWTSSYVGQTKEIVDIGTETPPFSKALHIKNTTSAYGGIEVPTIWSGVSAEGLVNKEITVSFWLKYQNIVQGSNSWNNGRFGEILIDGETATGTAVSSNTRFINKNTIGSTYINGTNMTWEKYSGTFKLTLPASAVKITAIKFRHALWYCAGEFWTTGVQIEVGNKATDWSPSPIDIEDRLVKTEFKVSDDSIVSTVTSSQIINASFFNDWAFDNGAKYWKSDNLLTTTLQGQTGVSEVLGVGTNGGKVLQLTGTKWVYFGNMMTINPNRKYRVKFRVRQTVNGTVANTSKVYAGVQAYDLNRQPLTTGIFGANRYCAISGRQLTIAEDWEEYSGLITGEGDASHNQFITGTRYIVPMFIVNYSGGDGTVQVDYCSLEDVTVDDALALDVETVKQAITPSGISTVISESTFYTNYQSEMNGKASADNDYASTKDVEDVADSIPSSIDAKINALNLGTTYATKLDLSEESTNITAKFSATGGMNLLKNSVGFAELNTTTNWGGSYQTTRIERVSNVELDTLGFGSGFSYPARVIGETRYITQDINVVVGQTYTLSWYMNKTNVSPSGDNNGAMVIQILESGINVKSYTYASETKTIGYEPKYFTFTPTIPKITVRIYGYGLAEATITGLMCTIGDLALSWSLATGETYNTNVRLDINGIRVSQLDANRKEIGYTQISPDEFAGFYDDNGNGSFEKIFYLNGDETVSKKIRALNEITMGTIKVINISGTYNGWAFVPV